MLFVHHYAGIYFSCNPKLSFLASLAGISGDVPPRMSIYSFVASCAIAIDASNRLTACLFSPGIRCPYKSTVIWME